MRSNTLKVLAKRLRERGFKTVEDRGRIRVVSRGRLFSRGQVEKIFEVVDRYGANTRVGKVIITKPRGKRQ